MTNPVAPFSTHPPKTCESLLTNSQGSSTGMVQGPRKSFSKFKNQNKSTKTNLKWGSNLKIQQACASASSVVVGVPSKLLCRACYTPNRHQKGLHRAQTELLAVLWGVHVPAVWWWARHRGAAWAQPRHCTRTLRPQGRDRTEWRVPERCCSAWKCQVHGPGKRGVCLWDRGHGTAARCKALDNPPMLLMAWSDTTRRKSHYVPYLQSKSVETLYVSCVSLCVLSSVLPAPYSFGTWTNAYFGRKQNCFLC